MVNLYGCLYRESTMGIATIWHLYGFINFINHGWMVFQLRKDRKGRRKGRKEEIKLT